MIQSRTNELEGSVGYNCELCIAKDMMGNHSGRLCFIHQIDFDNNDSLEWKSATRLGIESGVVDSIDSLMEGIDKLLTLHKTNRVEVALKFFRNTEKRISGICAKSFPKTFLTNHLLGKLNLCLGGANGNELTHFPCEGTLFDQPNIFIIAYYVYLDELNKFLAETRDGSKNH